MRLKQPVYGWICASCKARLRSKEPSPQTAQKRQNASHRQSAKLPPTPARTRFAPSPTGNLHLGSIRTALFNYLLAKRTKGQFLLRIEDTDQKRTVAGAEERLCDDLLWAGLEWDEGPRVGGPYGPYQQSARSAIYRTQLAPLLISKHAYRCFCSAERLDALNRSRHEQGLLLGYDRCCAEISVEESDDRARQGDAHVVRFRAPEQYPNYNDFVYGKIAQNANKRHKLHIDHPVYDDPILIKSDGFPTYHFANVVDDHLMMITHVIRGSEWMSSTPLHVALYTALGWQPPAFGHVPLLVDENRQKLSKRNLDTDIASFRDKQSIFPDALVNFAALLGWSHQQKKDIMDLKELEAIFEPKFTKGNTIVSFGKLHFLQEHHAKRRIQAGGKEFQAMVIGAAAAIVDKYGAAAVLTTIGRRKLADVVATILRSDSQGYSSPTTFAATRCSIFFGPPPQWHSYPSTETIPPSVLRTAAATLCLVPAERWTADVHRENLASLHLSPPDFPTTKDQQSPSSKTSKGEIYHYLRWALLGGAAGPGIPETMEILGRDICVERISKSGEIIRAQEQSKTRPEVTCRVLTEASECAGPAKRQSEQGTGTGTGTGTVL